MTAVIQQEGLLLVVDLDERGVFSAHVETENGQSIFDFTNLQSFDPEAEGDDAADDELWLITDGWMKHGRDATGLLEYLHAMGIVQKDVRRIRVQG